VGHVREMLLAEGQRAGAVGVIGFAEEENGCVCFWHNMIRDTDFTETTESA
jgi:hypothetical protein